MARKCIKSDYSRSHGFLTDGSAGLHPDQVDQSEGIEFLQPPEEWPDTGTAPASRPDDAENEEWRRYLRKREERSQVKILNKLLQTISEGRFKRPFLFVGLHIRQDSIEFISTIIFNLFADHASCDRSEEPT